MFTLGKTIKNLRIEKSWSESDLAFRLSLSKDMIIKIENDELLPDISLLPILATVFNVSIDYLMTGKTNETISYDNEFEICTKNDDVKLLENINIKALDNHNNPLFYYINKNESIKIFDYLLKNNLLKYTFGNKQMEYYKEDLIYLCLISNNLKKLNNLNILDIGALKKEEISYKFLKTFSTNNYIDESIEYVLNTHNREIKGYDYDFMPQNERHVRGNWQTMYPIYLEYAIKNSNDLLAYKIYDACLDANSYATKKLKEGDTSIKLCYNELDKYEAQKQTNLPVVYIPLDLLNIMLETNKFDLLRHFNRINKDVLAQSIDDLIIDTKELYENKNATSKDIFKIKYINNGLLNIRDLVRSINKPTKDDLNNVKELLNYPVTYVELVESYLNSKNYKKLFEFAIDYELDILEDLIINEEYEDIKKYIRKLFSYYDVLNDKSVIKLKEYIKEQSEEAEICAIKNNEFGRNRCLERIARQIEIEENNWFSNMINTNKEKLNKNIYKEMLEHQLKVVPFHYFMVMNDFIKDSFSYKEKYFNELLLKVGDTNE